MDESALSSTLAPVLTSFLHRANATKADVSQYMHKVKGDEPFRLCRQVYGGPEH